MARKAGLNVCVTEAREGYHALVKVVDEIGTHSSTVHDLDDTVSSPEQTCVKQDYYKRKNKDLQIFIPYPVSNLSRKKS